MFYGEATVEAGQTASFSEFIIPYADFGLLGVGFTSFKSGVISGLVEKYLADCMERDGVSFNSFFFYTMMFITRPVNFPDVYFLVFLIALILLQKVKLDDRLECLTARGAEKKGTVGIRRQGGGGLA